LVGYLSETVLLIKNEFKTVKKKKIIKILLCPYPETIKHQYDLLCKLTCRPASVFISILSAITSAGFFLFMVPKPLKSIQIYIAFIFGICMGLSIILVFHSAKWFTKHLLRFYEEEITKNKVEQMKPSD
jgi:hypothetical protein